jgi:DNA-directed RNA polymerase subunit RPC12/RpoP
MDDLISRQAAIDALGDAHFKNYGNAIMVIQTLPSAEPVRHGKWIHRGCGIFACSKCGKDVGLNVYTGEKASETFKWCPHCGARMDEE